MIRYHPGAPVVKGKYAAQVVRELLNTRPLPPDGVKRFRSILYELYGPPVRASRKQQEEDLR